MFGIGTKEMPQEAEKKEIPGENHVEERKNAILDEIMRFTGTENLEELEEVVKSVSQSGADEQDNDDRLYNALQTVKCEHSIMEAKEMEKNRDFIDAIAAGFDPEKAYKLAMCEQLIEQAYAEGENHGKTVAASRNDRIDEVGMKVTGGYKAEIDPSSMTLEELKKIKDRLNKGEKVRL